MLTPCLFWDRVWIRLMIRGRLVKEFCKNTKKWQSYRGGKISSLWIVTTICISCRIQRFDFGTKFMTKFSGGDATGVTARSVPPGKGLSNRSGKIHRNEKETVFLSWQGSFYEYTVCGWTFKGSTVFESMWTPFSVNVILLEPKSTPDGDEI